MRCCLLVIIEQTVIDISPVARCRCRCSLCLYEFLPVPVPVPYIDTRYQILATIKK